MFRVQRFPGNPRRPAARPAGRAAVRASAIFGAVALTLAAPSPASADSLIHIGPFSFPNPFANPAPAPGAPAQERSHRSLERRGSGDGPSHHHASKGGEGDKYFGLPGGSIYVCVRTCDGSFFPLPYSGSSGATLEDICQALCPNTAMALYSMPFGGTVDMAVSPAGAPYSAQPNALKFQQTFEASCSCRRPGQSWADALAGAEARFGHRSHELLVTAEVSAEMARPKADPNAKAAKTAQAPDGVAFPVATDPADPALDANGVDTRLKAAAAAVSRETSGIRDEATKTGSHFGLKEGEVLDEVDPDGGRRRVRVLAPTL